MLIIGGGGRGIAVMCINEIITPAVKSNMTKVESTENFGKLNWLQNFQKDDKDLEHVRWLLSGNPNTPALILDDLANILDFGISFR